MRRLSFLLFLGSIGSASPSASAPLPVEEIVAAERAFAADTAARGGAYSFRDVVAPDAIGMSPDPNTGILTIFNAKERLESRPLPPEVKPSTIIWWPSFAGAALSGEIGFTTGPVIFPEGRGHGFIFTVWERQADGKWKFYFDGGPRTDGPSKITPDRPTEILAPASARAASGEAAKAEVARIEAKIAKKALKDSKASYMPYLNGTTRLMGSGIQPTTGKAEAPLELERRGKAIVFEPLGSRASKSGDLVFTYGKSLADGKIHGGYTRIWQKTKQGWRIVIDQIQIPAPPPPAPAPQATPASTN